MEILTWYSLYAVICGNTLRTYSLKTWVALNTRWVEPLNAFDWLETGPKIIETVMELVMEDAHQYCTNNCFQRCFCFHLTTCLSTRQVHYDFLLPQLCGRAASFRSHQSQNLWPCEGVAQGGEWAHPTSPHGLHPHRPQEWPQQGPQGDPGRGGESGGRPGHPLRGDLGQVQHQRGPGLWAADQRHLRADENGWDRHPGWMGWCEERPHCQGPLPGRWRGGTGEGVRWKGLPLLTEISVCPNTVLSHPELAPSHSRPSRLSTPW